ATIIAVTFLEKGVGFQSFMVAASGWGLVPIMVLGSYKLISSVSVPRLVQYISRGAELLVFWGVVELFSKSLGFSYIHAITNLISDSDSGRVILTTSEPSWAVQILMFFSVFYLFNNNISRLRKIIYSLFVVVLFVSMASFFG